MVQGIDELRIIIFDSASFPGSVSVVYIINEFDRISTGISPAYKILVIVIYEEIILFDS